MKPAKLVAIGAAAVTAGWIATRILGHTGTILGWLLEPAVWAFHLARWALAPVGWIIGWMPFTHLFAVLLLVVGVGLVVGRAAVLGLRAGDRGLRRRKHLAAKDRIAELERALLAEQSKSAVRKG